MQKLIGQEHFDLTWEQILHKVVALFVFSFTTMSAKSNNKFSKKVLKPDIWLSGPFLPYRDFSKTIRLSYAQLHIAS